MSEFLSQLHSVLVGIDFSGNPERGRFSEYKGFFERARDAGLRFSSCLCCSELFEFCKHRTTIHCGEIVDDEDMSCVLDYKPDRLGHALYLNAQHVQRLADMSAEGAMIPIEVCPTSNLMTLGLGTHP
jgi:adenosine deaminase